MATEVVLVDGATAAEGGSASQPVAAKKKGKNKSLAARGPGALNKKCGTGFEEYFADPPMTLQEYVAERKIYPLDRPFEERIEECLARFRSRRRLDNNRSKLFSKYLSLGGIDTTNRQFQGGTKLGDFDLEGDETSGDVRRNDVLYSTDPRFYHPDFADDWEVDFTGVTQGFISEHLPRRVGYDSALLHAGIDVVLNFLNYLITHDVGPEHDEDIKMARAVCDVAKVELPRIAQLTTQLPGPFNLAARLLHPCQTRNHFSYDSCDLPVYDTETAKRVFMATVASSGLLTSMVLGAEKIECISTFEQTYELKELLFPEENLRTFHTGVQATSEDGGTTGTTPCGWITLTPTTVDDKWDNEQPHAADALDVEVFYLETDLMEKLRVGMKMRLMVGILNVDLRIIREAREVYPTFYKFLPQELMLTYRDPMPDYREPPSVSAPDAEEVAMDKLMDKDFD